MGQPAAAGVIVGVIFIALIGSVVGYKLYKKWQWRKISRQQVSELPAISDVGRSSTATTPLNFPSRAISPGPSMAGSLYGGEVFPRDSMGRASMSKASFSSIRSPHAVPYMGSSASEYTLNRPRHSSTQGLMYTAFPTTTPGEDASVPSSPVSQSAGGRAISPEPYDGPTHTRVLSSASSTMTLRRSYAGSTFRNMSGSVSPGPGHSYRRDSYLPHLPENRDAIQIVPPQPLGFSFGMAQALDQRTLAFSTTSGIGNFDNDLMKGLVWENGQPATGEEAEEALREHISRSASVADEQRQRYLAQGPSRSLTPAMRGAIHNHLYPSSQQGSSGAQTPDGAGSRPRSPAQGDWAGSSSDIGPSVSQRGAMPPSHPLEATGSSQSTRSAQAALTSAQSPLGLISVGRDDGAADISTNTVSDSPILQAFQNPSAQAERRAVAASAASSAVGGPSRSQSNAATPLHTPHDSLNSTRGPATPGLISSDSHSQSSKNTEGATPIEFRASADQYMISQDGTTTQQDKRIELGKDGRLHVWGADASVADPLTGGVPATLPQDAAKNKRASRGWFSSSRWTKSNQDTSAA